MNLKPESLRQPNITVRQLFHFVVAAETGTLAEAGRLLHMAPSAISYSIDQLESSLGVQLCIRHKAKGLTLTPSGQDALTRIRNLMSDIRELESLFTQDGIGNSGRIIVGSSTPIAPLVLPPTHKIFSERFPEASIQFLEESQERLQERLMQGTIDLAFMYDLNIVHHLHRIPLRRLMPNVLFPQNHPLAAADGPDEIPLTLLAQERFVLFEGPPLYEAYLRLFREEGIAPNVSHTCRSMGTLRAFVGRGTALGLAYETYTLGDSVEGIPIVSKPLQTRADNAVTVCIALPQDTKPSTLANAWIEAARRVL